MPKNWLPEAITSTAEQVDSLFGIIMILSVIVFVLVEFCLIYFLIKYRRTRKNQIGTAIHGNTRLEIIWTAVPALILVALGIFSTQMTFAIQKPSAQDVYQIDVVGRKWSWEFKYPNGASTINDLRIPEGKNVVLKVTSADVVHSLWLPEARIKQDAVPGRITQINLGVVKPGTYRVECAEYCGTQHSKMLATMKTEPDASFEKFLVDAKKASESGPQAGEKLALQFGCLSCHAIDASKKVGPSWKGIYDSQRKLQGGAEVKADDGYLKESMLNPGAKIADGFANSMPSFQGKLDDQQVQSLIEYIKTLK